jgi:hypothetical protein
MLQVQACPSESVHNVCPEKTWRRMNYLNMLKLVRNKQLCSVDSPRQCIFFFMLLYYYAMYCAMYCAVYMCCALLLCICVQQIVIVQMLFYSNSQRIT